MIKKPLPPAKVQAYADNNGLAPHTPGPMKFHPDTITTESLRAAADMAAAVAHTLRRVSCDSEDGTIDPQTAALAANAALADLVGPVAMAGEELLAELQSLLDHFEIIQRGNRNQHGANCHAVAPAVFERARAAIAKAKGAPFVLPTINDPAFTEAMSELRGCQS